ncbi:L-fucose mutarotase [Vibrio salinus]|uniref:L-fucose mutarotase n=1 Tax=Vibrio salinus TaxID=2899784 RepID=UPI001E5205C2|nr:L-fucose mutarotase [Vibrio salinus]MCE0492413.1 L-fucose mutarotase [Vibrio salinus]
MLKGINPIISPELLKTLSEMGHGDELVLADAHFPGHKIHHRVLRMDGISIDMLLDGITPLFEFDSYADAPLIMMDAVVGDELDPKVEGKYMDAIRKYTQDELNLQRIERFAFYERAKKAFAVVVTGETAKYGNIIIKKGVTPAYKSINR